MNIQQKQIQNPNKSANHGNSVFPTGWVNIPPALAMEFASISKVLFWPIYAEVMWKLLDIGRASETETLRASFNEALLRAVEKNTGLASYSWGLPTSADGTRRPMTKQEVASEAAKISLERFLSKDELQKLHDLPLEKWWPEEIRYARTLVSFSITAKYGKLGLFQHSDQEVLLEMLVKLFKDPRINKYPEFLEEADRQRMTMESGMNKTRSTISGFRRPPAIPTTQELIVATRNHIAQKISNFFSKNQSMKLSPVKTK